MKKKKKTTKTTKVQKKEDLNELDYYHHEGKFGKFEVRKTANGWWGSQFGGKAKLVTLLAGIKMDFKHEQACGYAGITKKQMDYFLQCHPEFCEIMPLLAERINISAQANVAQSIVGTDNSNPDVENSKWWLERRNRGKFSTRQEFTGADGEPFDTLTAEDRIDIARAFLKSKGVSKV